MAKWDWAACAALTVWPAVAFVKRFYSKFEHVYHYEDLKFYFDNWTKLNVKGFVGYKKVLFPIFHASFHFFWAKELFEHTFIKSIVFLLKLRFDWTNCLTEQTISLNEWFNWTTVQLENKYNKWKMKYYSEKNEKKRAHLLYTLYRCIVLCVN